MSTSDFYVSKIFNLLSLISKWRVSYISSPIENYFACSIDDIKYSLTSSLTSLWLFRVDKSAILDYCCIWTSKIFSSLLLRYNISSPFYSESFSESPSPSLWVVRIIPSWNILRSDETYIVSVFSSVTLWTNHALVSDTF